MGKGTAPEWAAQWLVFGLKDLAIFKLLDLAGKLAIVVTIGAWWLDRGQRLEEAHDRAWTLIVQANGIVGEAGRKAALLRLREDGVDLSGLPLHNANLSVLDFHNAELGFSDFSGSHLDVADFSDSRMMYVDFEGSSVSFPVFKRAFLAGANFKGASLDYNQPDAFSKANLAAADFTGATLSTPISLDAEFCHTHMPDGQVNDRDCGKQNMIFVTGVEKRLLKRH